MIKQKKISWHIRSNASFACLSSFLMEVCHFQSIYKGKSLAPAQVQCVNGNFLMITPRLLCAFYDNGGNVSFVFSIFKAFLHLLCNEFLLSFLCCQDIECVKLGYKYPGKNEKRREQRFCLAVVQNIGPRGKQNKYLSTE